MQKEYEMTPEVVAQYCQVSKVTVLNWIKTGKLEAFRLPSGHYRIEKEDFRDFLDRYDMPIREQFFESEPKKQYARQSPFCKGGSRRIWGTEG